jgi:hypothetical protein
VADQLQRLNEEYHDAYVAGGLASADVSGTLQNHEAHGRVQKYVSEESNRRVWFGRVATSAGV